MKKLHIISLTILSIISIDTYIVAKTVKVFNYTDKPITLFLKSKYKKKISGVNQTRHEQTTLTVKPSSSDGKAIVQKGGPYYERTATPTEWSYQGDLQTFTFTDGNGKVCNTQLKINDNPYIVFYSISNGQAYLVSYAGISPENQFITPNNLCMSSRTTP